MLFISLLCLFICQVLEKKKCFHWDVGRVCPKHRPVASHIQLDHVIQPIRHGLRRIRRFPIHGGNPQSSSIFVRDFPCHPSVFGDPHGYGNGQMTQFFSKDATTVPLVTACHGSFITVPSTRAHNEDAFLKLLQLVLLLLSSAAGPKISWASSTANLHGSYKFLPSVPQVFRGGPASSCLSASFS